MRRFRRLSPTRAPAYTKEHGQSDAPDEFEIHHLTDRARQSNGEGPDGIGAASWTRLFADPYHRVAAVNADADGLPFAVPPLLQVQNHVVMPLLAVAPASKALSAVALKDERPWAFS